VLAESDHNLFFKTSDSNYSIVELQRPPTANVVFPLAQWQAMGYDQHSLVADPLFVNPKENDYRLHPDSPALKLGFVPIDVSKIGIRPRE
jgi:hypothetical protein